MGFGGRTTEKITGESVINDGFYPDIDLGHFQETARINTEYRIETMRNRITLAIIYVNRELKEKKFDWETEGFEDLASVSVDEIIDEDFVYEMMYREAVYAHAKANLLQDYKSMNRRDDAENEAKESSSSFDDYMADCHDAVKWFTGEQGSLEIYSV